MNKYNIGDRFILRDIKVVQNTNEMDKSIHYHRVVAEITSIHTETGMVQYILSFDNRTIIVLTKYIDKLEKINDK